MTTGCIEVNALSEEGAHQVLACKQRTLITRSVVLDDSIVPQRMEQKAVCGWRFSRIDGKRGLADAIILVPHMTKSRLTIPKPLVEQWVRGVPLKATLWSQREKKRLPKLLVVLEEWISPIWACVSSYMKTDDPGPSAAGLLVYTPEGPVPEWLIYLALHEERLTVAHRFGNTAVFIPHYIWLLRCRNRRSGWLQWMAYL